MSNVSDYIDIKNINEIDVCTLPSIVDKKRNLPLKTNFNVLHLPLNKQHKGALFLHKVNLLKQGSIREQVKLAQHRKIMFRFLPYFDHDIEGKTKKKTLNLKCLTQRKNNSMVKSSKTFEDIPKHYPRLEIKELMEEICQIAKGYMKKDWLTYLVQHTGSSPSLDIVNEQAGRTYSLDEIAYLKKMFHDSLDLSKEELQDVLNKSFVLGTNENIPTDKLGDFPERAFKYEGESEEESPKFKQVLNNLTQSEEEVDVLKIESILQLPGKSYFKFAVLTLDSGANVCMASWRTFQQLQGQMSDIIPVKDAVIYNSSETLKGDAIIGLASLKIKSWNSEKLESHYLGHYEFYIVKSEMPDIILGMGVLKSMETVVQFKDPVQITVKVHQDGNFEKKEIPEYKALITMTNVHNINVEQIGERTVRMRVPKCAYFPYNLMAQGSGWEVPEQISPVLNTGNQDISQLTENDLVREFDLRINFNDMKIWKRGELVISFRGETIHNTGLALNNQVGGMTFYGHQVDSNNLTDLAQTTIPTEELLKGEKIDLSYLDKTLQEKFVQLINEYKSIFTRSQNMVGRYSKKKFGLKFSGEFKSCDYSMKFTPEQLECMSQEIDQLLSTNIIQKCVDNGSPLSPIFCVGKNRAKMNIAQKMEGDELTKFETFRMVMDCRRINSVTIGQKFVELPRSESIIASVANKLVSIIDVKAAYFSLVLEEETADRFRFRFNGVTYRFNRVVMGGIMSMQQLMEALSETLSQAEFELFRQLKKIKGDIK